MGKQLARIHFGVLAVLIASLVGPSTADAQRRVVELTYLPTARAQIAIWIETGDGTFLRTLRLTDAVARRGIGNRPGAMQMNSGYHWPYGRREGVLPIWGHRRLTQEGVTPFRRVIFQDRLSEGFASRTSADASPDRHYCLSFNRDFSSKETLESIDEVDAMACPTLFNSDKGRYLTEPDVTAGYAEPFEDEMGVTTDMRVMNLTSLYPARRDLESFGADDHPDAALFVQETREAMPEIDAVTMATPPGDDIEKSLQFTLPMEWAEGEYVLYIEVNVEGDYHESWGPTRFPTPTGDRWDIWAESYGYPYRGQPSILYAVPFTLDGAGGVYTTQTAEGYGEIHGIDGDVRPIDETIQNDPVRAPGSGVDRLRVMSGMTRARFRVVPTNICDGPEPPDACFRECETAVDCDEANFVCYLGECIDECNTAVVTAPAMVGGLEAGPLDRPWAEAEIRFTAPETMRDLQAYQVRVATAPYDPSTPFEEWGVEAKKLGAEEAALIIDPNTTPGQEVVAQIGHLVAETPYYIGVRAVDECSAAAEVAVVEIETTEVQFTTVSPCFVATATYGTPMAEEVGSLRRFRDRYLMSNGPGRALVEAYYDAGPTAADAIREDDSLRALSRAILEPIVELAEWLVE